MKVFRSNGSPVRRVIVAVAALLGMALCAPQRAGADGPASTRNIIFGAAAVGGTLLILNHNKKVHEKYAEYDRRQAEDEAAKNQAQAAYDSERQAYAHEVALVGEYQQETAYQRSQVGARDREIASLKHSLIAAKYGAHSRNRLAFGQHLRRRAPRVAHGSQRTDRRWPQRSVVAARRPSSQSRQGSPQVVSYGWGDF